MEEAEVGLANKWVSPETGHACGRVQRHLAVRSTSWWSPMGGNNDWRRLLAKGCWDSCQTVAEGGSVLCACAETWIKPSLLILDLRNCANRSLKVGRLATLLAQPCSDTV